MLLGDGEETPGAPHRSFRRLLLLGLSQSAYSSLPAWQRQTAPGGEGTRRHVHAPEATGAPACWRLAAPPAGVQQQG